MCAVSAMYDFGQHIPMDTWTWDLLEKYKKALEDVKKVDDLAGVPDCEDPSKAEFLRNVELHVKKVD